MDELSIKYIGGVLYGLSHVSNVDEFSYKYTMTGNATKYTKNNARANVFLWLIQSIKSLSPTISLQFNYFKT